MNIDDYVWQRTSGDEWIFGPMVRGIVREIVAEVYFNEKDDSREGGWIWLTLHGPKMVRGNAPSLQHAAAFVEEALVAPS